MQYADEIFTLGGELEDALREGRSHPRAPVVRIGVVDSVPKSVSYHVVEPAIRMSPAPKLVCSEGKLAGLLAQLAVRQLDLIVSDVPLPGNSGVKAFSHLLGRSGITFFAAGALLAQRGWSLQQARKRFPGVLAELPLLLPGRESGLRPRVEAYLRGAGLAPAVAGEFDDGALLKAFGREGLGVFPAPAVLAREISRQFQVDAIGSPEDLVEEFYAISIERRISHPAVSEITAAARTELFKGG
jgi:LysR family transcriptional activator of nhaA